LARLHVDSVFSGENAQNGKTSPQSLAIPARFERATYRLGMAPGILRWTTLNYVTPYFFCEFVKLDPWGAR